MSVEISEKAVPKDELRDDVDTPTTRSASVEGRPLERTDSYLDDTQVKLGWRSYAAVIVACFGYAQECLVYAVVAAGTIIAFIIRDLGDAPLAGWIIQARPGSGPLLMQSVLCPIVGRLSDVLDRKYLAAFPPLVAFAGCVLSAKATSMKDLVGGGILIGTTLSTGAIVQAIPAEVLPLKYRALANGFGGIAGSLGGLVSALSAGAVTNANPGGWRAVFWIQGALHLTSGLGLLLFYWPKPSDYPRMSVRAYLWACDPIGSLAFIGSTALILLALDWAGGAFPWHDPHVAVPLSVGLALLVAFALYEWKGRTDGLIAHVFFKRGANFPLALFAFAVEGWIFFSAVNSITPQVVLNLGFETTAWRISIRQLSYSVMILLGPLPLTLWATKARDLKSPLLATFALFLVVTICYATIKPSFNDAQIAYSIMSGLAQAGPLSLLIAVVQFTAPHTYLSTSTGIALSARAIGGAFGSAVLNAIINGHLSSHYAPTLIAAGADGAMIARISAGNFTDVPQAVVDASHNVYARAYNLAWASIAPFVVMAIVAVACLKGVSELMTEHVEATVEFVEDLALAEVVALEKGKTKH
ncbi:MFS general substrate transporter [Exidia glandulosa HHB12029]|uniref:MFS general substrate transporter n=1 Tax=Exidia glandulosa HHB12029 TaxID=1314781 RepID=A0A165MNM2_EXIGL|nr:MFS general substrate transporter [Exidia glandulosa HHB12029]